jgi:hypothetical protein
MGRKAIRFAEDELPEGRVARKGQPRSSAQVRSRAGEMHCRCYRFLKRWANFINGRIATASFSPP